MPGHGAVVGCDHEKAAAAFLVSISGVPGVIVVVRDLVAVQVIGNQRAHVHVIVPGLPPCIVMVEHRPEAGQQGDSSCGSEPTQPDNEAPNGRKPHDEIIAEGKGLL